MPQSEPWPIDGFASSSAAGKTANPTTTRPISDPYNDADRLFRGRFTPGPSRFRNTLHIGIDLDVEFFGGDEPIDIRCIDGQDSLVVVLDILKRRRHLEVQTGLVDDLFDLAEREHHGELALVDHEQA